MSEENQEDRGDPEVTANMPTIEQPGSIPEERPAARATTPPSRWAFNLGVIFLVMALLGTGIAIGWALSNTGTSGSSVALQEPAAIPSGKPGQALSVGDIANRVSPAVVDIYTATAANPFGASTPGGSGREVPTGAATGMILTSSGQVLTNNHVVAGATNLSVEIDGRSGRYSAHVVGASPAEDVALIQLEGVSGLPTVTLGNSASLNVGDQVVAIGNALGRGAPAISSGTVSALNRFIVVGDGRGGVERLHGLIQTNLAIQPGESGGPLVNASGQVVGMVTASRRGPFGGPSGSSFAVPTSSTARVVSDVRLGRESSSVFIGPVGYIGISVAPVEPEVAARLGLGEDTGVQVERVYPGGPADRAGLPESSVITAVDGQAISSVDGLSPVIHSHKPGERIQLTWVDLSGRHSADVTLVAGPAV